MSVGYQWVLSNRFNIEASLGIGYVHARYDKYKCATCGKKLGKGDADYIGPTRAAISIIYMLKYLPESGDTIFYSIMLKMYINETLPY